MDPDAVPFGTIAVLHQGVNAVALTHWLRWPPQARMHLETPQGNQIARGRNRAAYAMYGSFVLFVDSDVVPTPDALPRLWAHGVPIVAAVCHERYPPFDIAATRSLEPPAKWTVAELPARGLLPVPAVGAACLLIRREVLEAVEAPWFRCGELYPDLLTEDTGFALRAAQRGYPSYLACDVRVGHAVSGTAWPGRDGQMWIEWPGPGDYRTPMAMAAGNGGAASARIEIEVQAQAVEAR